VLGPMCQQAAATLAEAGTAPEAVQINRHVDRRARRGSRNVNYAEAADKQEEAWEAQ